MTRARLALALAAAALILGGCGAAKETRPQGNRIAGGRLTIYVSAPRNGPSRATGDAVLDGATLALDQQHGRIGRYHIALRALDDDDPVTGVWSPTATSQAAVTAAANRTTIGYIGDYDSGASAVSVPILNKLSIPQVSPTSTAVGLTSGGIGSTPGDEPFDYYPTPRRTFVRVVPSDYVQAVVQVKLQRELGCTSVYVLYDGEYDGAESANAFQQVAQDEHYPVISMQSYAPGASSYVSIGQTVAQDHANCILIAALPALDATKLVEQVAEQVPLAKIFATASLAQPSFTDPAAGGIPGRLDHRVLITASGGDPYAHNSLLASFTRAYEHRYGAPLPAAVDGYEAMRLLLAAITRASDRGRGTVQRTRVVFDLHMIRRHASPLGTYGIEPDGNTTLDSEDVYRIVGGALRFCRAMRA